MAKFKVGTALSVGTAYLLGLMIMAGAVLSAGDYYQHYYNGVEETDPREVGHLGLIFGGVLGLLIREVFMIATGAKRSSIDEVLKLVLWAGLSLLIASRIGPFDPWSGSLKQIAELVGIAIPVFIFGFGIYWRVDGKRKADDRP